MTGNVWLEIEKRDKGIADVYLKAFADGYSWGTFRVFSSCNLGTFTTADFSSMFSNYIHSDSARPNEDLGIMYISMLYDRFPCLRGRLTNLDSK